MCLYCMYYICVLDVLYVLDLHMCLRRIISMRRPCLSLARLLATAAAVREWHTSLQAVVKAAGKSVKYVYA